MELPIKTVAAIVLTIMVVFALIAVAVDVFGKEGDQIGNVGDQKGNELDCVLRNPEETDKCNTGSTTEVINHKLQI